jgi:hypothetical protein
MTYMLVATMCSMTTAQCHTYLLGIYPSEQQCVMAGLQAALIASDRQFICRPRVVERIPLPRPRPRR